MLVETGPNLFSPALATRCAEGPSCVDGLVRWSFSPAAAARMTLPVPSGRESWQGGRQSSPPILSQKSVEWIVFQAHISPCLPGISALTPGCWHCTSNRPRLPVPVEAVKPSASRAPSRLLWRAPGAVSVEVAPGGILGVRPNRRAGTFPGAVRASALQGSYPSNPRKNDAVVDRLRASIREFGFKYPLLARGDGDVVDGPLRMKAAKKLRISEVPRSLHADPPLNALSRLGPRAGR